jgi:proline iminopeptidase
MTAGRTSEEVRVAVAGGSLVGSRAGVGEPALLVHGGPGLADYTGPLADELASYFDIIRYQQRGLSPSLDAGPYDIETNVADAIAVLDALGLERVWLVGHSWGGHLAMHIAVAAPERVRGLISIACRGAIPDGGINANFAALRQRYEALYGRPPTAITLEEGWPLRFSNPREAPAFPGIAVNGAVLREVEKSVKEHYERRTLVLGLPQLNVPALFIHGRLDPLPLSASEDTARLIPGATVEVIENCGHFPWVEYPSVIGRLVSRYLAKVVVTRQTRPNT